MNTFLILIVVVVIFCYFGEKNCPLLLRKNKEILLGILIGLLLCSFMGLKIEGFCEKSGDCPVSKPYCVSGGVNGKYCSSTPPPIHAPESRLYSDSYVNQPVRLPSTAHNRGFGYH